MIIRHGWWPLGAALVVAGLAGGAGPVVALGLSLLLVGLLARTWARRSLDRVQFERLLPEWRGFPGERLRLTYRLANRKPLPLIRLEMTDNLPEALTPPELDLPPSGRPRTNLYAHSTHLGWYERASWSIDLDCRERGYYRLGPAGLRAGDGFGLFSEAREVPNTAGVVVYPRTTTLPGLGLPAARPLGERKGYQRIFEDPLRIAGVRDYQPSDPIRRIDWKATARRGQLQSRVYEPSTTHSLIVALNVDTLEHSWMGHIPELLEANITVAASVARWAYESRYAVGLLANGSLPGSERPLNIRPGRAPDQLGRILEALAGTGTMTTVSLATLLENETHSLPLGVTLVVVASIMPEPLAATLRRLHASGQTVVVLSTVDDDWRAILDMVPVRRAKPLGDETAQEASPRPGSAS